MWKHMPVVASMNAWAEYGVVPLFAHVRSMVPRGVVMCIMSPACLMIRVSAAGM